MEHTYLIRWARVDNVLRNVWHISLGSVNFIVKTMIKSVDVGMGQAVL